MTTNRTIGQLRENARRNGAPGPRVEPTEQWMTLWDGTRLFYRAWLPARPASKALVLFHRGHEHSGRLQDVVERLHLTDVAVFAWDARGHGRSPGARGWAPSFGTLVRDVDSFVHQLTRTYNIPIANMVVMAHSVGAVTVATWVHDYAPGIRALVLATPALRVRLYVPLAIPGLRLLSRLKGRKPAFVQSYVKSRMLTHDENEARRYEEDPLITRAIAVNILLGMYDASTRLLADAGAIRVPTLVLSGGADWVVHLSAQRTFFEQLGSPQKKLCLFPGMYHDVLHEKDNEPVLEEARRFIAEQLAREDQGELLLDADEQGYTRDEYVRLNRPLKPLSLRRWQYRGLELGMKSLGRLSAGIRLGWRSGFDSGRTLDYVYENTARGALGIGVLFDRLYLDGAGWRGIRQRKSLLEKLLRRALGSHVAAGRPVHCVDVAAGPGRYLLDT
ncbi:MAG: alpha/beta fold hydrolase, partial [bacterium]|nr:alpha/beta fold hydrolase [bacterium]